jgi:ABC-type multidrug transport system permease subunit
MKKSQTKKKYQNSKQQLLQYYSTAAGIIILIIKIASNRGFSCLPVSFFFLFLSYFLLVVEIQRLTRTHTPTSSAVVCVFDNTRKGYEIVR